LDPKLTPPPQFSDGFCQFLQILVEIQVDIADELQSGQRVRVVE
jgi:hypothetical protein